MGPYKKHGVNIGSRDEDDRPESICRGVCKWSGWLASALQWQILCSSFRTHPARIRGPNQAISVFHLDWFARFLKFAQFELLTPCLNDLRVSPKDKVLVLSTSDVVFCAMILDNMQKPGQSAHLGADKLSCHVIATEAPRDTYCLTPIPRVKVKASFQDPFWTTSFGAKRKDENKTIPELKIIPAKHPNS